MKISPNWLRDFVDLKVDEHKLADDLTMCGLAVEGTSGEGADTVFEVEFTTNRVDAMNHYGVARECSAIYDLELKPIWPVLPPAKTVSPQFTIKIQDAEGCARYTARVIRNVKIGLSPECIVTRLESLEQRSINNVADASNYTLWEIGHPTHAFDLDLLDGGKIIVRRAREGETLKTLDGVEHNLTSEDLVIADAKKPVALAGVMGGFDSMITEKTCNVLIESAWFDPVTVRKMARRHGMHTDASHRFERGADYAITPLACARVTQLILESAGGELEGNEFDAVTRKVEHAPVTLHPSEVTRVLGKEIAQHELKRILQRLGFCLSQTGADYTVQIPTWRLDVEREIDLIEEIARIHGYGNFPNTLPEFSGAVIELPDALKDALMRERLLALGYNEAMSLTFVAKADTDAFSSTQPVEIANPLSEEAGFMRNSIVPGMLDMIAYNLNRGNNDVRLFESGNIYERAGERTAEHKQICIGATGNAPQASVHEKPRAYTFFDLKGDIEALLAVFDQRSLYFDAHSAPYYHPGRSSRAVLNGATVARFGQLHPETSAARKLRQEVFIAELYLDRLYLNALRKPRYSQIPRYPSVGRDFSFVFDSTVIFEQIRMAVDGLQLAGLRSFVPVETFRGGAIPAGKYSMLLRAEFRSADRTLRDDEVTLWASRIIKVLESLGGTLRS